MRMNPKDRHRPTKRPGFWLLPASIALSLLFSGLAFAPPAPAQTGGETQATQGRDNRPYDKELFELAEVLGAIHYLRALCGADEGQRWRDQMRGLVDAEGNSALRRAQLVRSFNKGYRGYGRTYRRCTELARLSIERLLKDGRVLARRMLDTAG